MRTLAITQNMSLDGSIEFLGSWFDGSGAGEQTDQLAELRAQQARSDGLLVGRRTFEDFRGYWPLQTDDRTGITAHLNQVEKYVVSTTMTDPQWENSTVLGGDLVSAVRALKEREGRDIVVTGSIRLCHALITAGLVDEYRLFVYPAVQGRGRRLFPDGHEADLRLAEATSFRGGVTYARYTAAPEMRTTGLGS